MKKIYIVLLSLLLLILSPQCVSAKEVSKSENVINLTKKIYYFNFKNIPPLKYKGYIRTSYHKFSNSYVGFYR